jgi:hypothetical protein
MHSACSTYIPVCTSIGQLRATFLMLLHFNQIELHTQKNHLIVVSTKKYYLCLHMLVANVKKSFSFHVFFMFFTTFNMLLTF